MRRLWLFLIPLAFIVLTPSHARAQQGNTVIIRFAGAPSGSCSPVSIAVNNATGDFYDCKAAVWTLVGPAGGAHALIINGGGWLDLSGVGQLPPGGGDGSTVLLYADVDASVGYNALFHTLTRPSTSFTFVSTQTSDATNIGATAGGFYDFITFDPVNHLVTIQPDSSGIAKSTTPFQVNNHLQFEPGDSSIGRIAANSLTIGNGTAADFSGTLKLTTLTSVGSVSGATHLTATRCAAIGTAANPSVASCAAAAAGAFSCATNASAATCTVNTTAVTANSTVIVQESAAENTPVGVTCNTAPTVTPAILLASKVAATSFTINMPTITVNPACFVYWIVN